MEEIPFFQYYDFLYIQFFLSIRIFYRSAAHVPFSHWHFILPLLSHRKMMKVRNRESESNIVLAFVIHSIHRCSLEEITVFHAFLYSLLSFNKTTEQFSCTCMYIYWKVKMHICIPFQVLYNTNLSSLSFILNTLKFFSEIFSTPLCP